MEQEAPVPVEEEHNQAQETTDEGHHGLGAAPRGAFAFVMGLGLFYLVYWLITWFEIFVLRGA